MVEHGERVLERRADGRGGGAVAARDEEEGEEAEEGEGVRLPHKSDEESGEERRGGGGHEEENDFPGRESRSEVARSARWPRTSLRCVGLSRGLSRSTAHSSRLSHAAMSAAIFDGIAAGLKADPSIAKKANGVFQFNLSKPASEWVVDCKAATVKPGRRRRRT